MNNNDNLFDEEVFKKEFLKRARITQDEVIIHCDICSPLLWNDNNIDILRKLGLPNEKFCSTMNDEFIRRIYFELVKKSLE